MPNELQPSDHAPLAATFEVKSTQAQLEGLARQWLDAFTVDSSSFSLMSLDELRDSFSFFDPEDSGLVTPEQLEAALRQLAYPCSGAGSGEGSGEGSGAGSLAAEAERICTAVREACPSATGPESPSECATQIDGITFADFARAFTAQAERMTGEAQTVVQLRIAFSLFDGNGDGVLTKVRAENSRRRGRLTLDS